MTEADPGIGYAVQLHHPDSHAEVAHRSLAAASLGVATLIAIVVFVPSITLTLRSSDGSSSQTLSLINDMPGLAFRYLSFCVVLAILGWAGLAWSGRREWAIRISLLIAGISLFCMLMTADVSSSLCPENSGRTCGNPAYYPGRLNHDLENALIEKEKQAAIPASKELNPYIEGLSTWKIIPWTIGILFAAALLVLCSHLFLFRPRWIPLVFAPLICGAVLILWWVMVFAWAVHHGYEP